MGLPVSLRHVPYLFQQPEPQVNIRLTNKSSTHVGIVTIRREPVAPFELFIAVDHLNASAERFANRFNQLPSGKSFATGHV